MRVENGSTYESNYARAAAFFLGSMSAYPEEESRRCAFDMITCIYEAIAKSPEKIGYKPIRDTTFTPWEQQKGREKDIKAIRDAIKKVEMLIAELFHIVETGTYDSGMCNLPHDLKISRALNKTLALIGSEAVVSEFGSSVPMTKECWSGLKELCLISKQNLIPITDGPLEDKSYLYFSRCVFEPTQNWVGMAYDQVLKANGCLLWLCEELEKRGYQRVDCRDGKVVSLDYVKQHGKKEEPLKAAWGERTHSGISVTYEDLRLEPCFLWIRVPMFKTILSCAEQLPDNVQTFIAENTKTCDGCRYCVQTDKTHSRPLACVAVNGVKKCPLYPGFSMNWRSLDDNLAKNILEFLDAINSLPELKQEGK